VTTQSAYESCCPSRKGAAHGAIQNRQSVGICASKRPPRWRDARHARNGIGPGWARPRRAASWHLENSRQRGPLPGRLDRHSNRRSASGGRSYETYPDRGFWRVAVPFVVPGWAQRAPVVPLPAEKIERLCRQALRIGPWRCVPLRKLRPSLWAGLTKPVRPFVVLPQMPTKPRHCAGLFLCRSRSGLAADLDHAQ
jgi:hypothetical protein